MSLRAYASTAKPASSQQNSLLLTSLLILSDVPDIRNLPFSHIHYEVYWPFITDILRQVMCRNLSQIIASYSALGKPLFLSGFQAILVLQAMSMLLGYSNLSRLSHQDAVVLRRLRVGHTRLTHSYLLN